MISGQKPSRTLVASVLFVDLVEFSRTSVAEQIEVKRALTRILRRTLSSIANDDYRLMDTGDGAAIGFVADPEHALYFALAIDAACREEHHALGLGPGTLRIGINLGPVKDVLDVNDRPSLIGDGMNTAQRIVSFAQPGQITISRSFFELVSRLAPEYSGIFVHIGAHDDKHGREHDVYVINPSKEILDKIQERLQLTVAEATGMNVVFKARPDAMAAPAPASTSTVEPPRPVSVAPPPPDRPAASNSVPSTAAASTAAASATAAPPAASTTAPAGAMALPRFRLLPIAVIAALLLGATVILTPLLTKRSTQPAVSPPAAPTRSDSAPPKAPPTVGSTVPNTGSVAGSPPSGKEPSSSGAVVATPTTGAPKGGATAGVAAVPAAPQASQSTNTTRGATTAASSDTATAKRNVHPAAAAQPVTRASDKVNATTRSAPTTSGANAASRGTYSRCSALMQKTTLGESLTPAERQEMEQFCR